MSSLTQENAEKALDYLLKTAEQYGDLLRNTTYLREKVKIIESQLFNESEAKGVDARKADAKARPEYHTVVEELSKVEGELAYLKAMRDAASAKISLFQSILRDRRGVNL